MKVVGSLVILGGLAVAAWGAQTTPQKEVSLKGKVMCARCELKMKEFKQCQTVIEVQEGGKAVLYFFKDKGHEESYHEEVCGGGRKDATVTGTVEEKDGKKWITPKKVEYAKQEPKEAAAQQAAAEVGCCAVPATRVRVCGCCCCR
jgi:hypothetical protein